MRRFYVGRDLFAEFALVLNLGPEISEVDPQEGKKVCWNERVARLFACDCAEHVVQIYKDARLRVAIDVARKYAVGKIGVNELSAAWSAARDVASQAKWLNEYCAARSASDCAAIDVEWGWGSATFAAAAKSGSARDKKGSTLNQSVAWIDERAWQTSKLMRYLDGAA